MKPRLIILVVVLLLVAMIPALVMAQSQAKPGQIVSFTIDRRLPAGPQIQAALGASIGAPKAAAPAAASRQLPAALGIQPNAVQGLLNESFEGPWPTDPNWLLWDFSFSGYTWGATDYVRKRGQQSAWVAGTGGDPYAYPYYVDGMDSWMDYPMDLSAANKGNARFQYRNDSEFGYDYFVWCGSHDGFFFDCQGHTGSTNGKWRLVKINLANFEGENYLGDSGFVFTWGFISDGSIVDEGSYVDAVRIRATGP